MRVAADGNDTEALLVFHEGRLAAVLVHLSHDHEEVAGKWFLEVGFGRLTTVNPPVFADLDEAQDWIARRVTRLGEAS